MDHPLLNLEIRRLFGDFFSHVSTSPIGIQLDSILLACRISDAKQSSYAW